jgi:hypothetical protein
VTIKVEDVPTDHVLASEFQTEQPTISQHIPRDIFRRSRAFAVISGELLFARSYLSGVHIPEIQGRRRIDADTVTVVTVKGAMA